MDEATVTAKGRITIPKAIRRRLGLKPGSRLRFFVGHDDRVMILPVVPVSSLRGIVKHDGPPVTIEEMDEAIAEGIVARFERSKYG